MPENSHRYPDRVKHYVVSGVMFLRPFVFLNLPIFVSFLHLP